MKIKKMTVTKGLQMERAASRAVCDVCSVLLHRGEDGAMALRIARCSGNDAAVVAVKIMQALEGETFAPGYPAFRQSAGFAAVWIA